MAQEQNSFCLILFTDQRFFRRGGGGGAVLGLIFAVPLASQSPYPIIFYSVANYRLHLSHFGVYVQFSRSQLSHFLFLWIDPFFLDWVKNTLLFICCTNNLVRLLTVNMKNSFTPKNPKMCDPILVTLLKMRLHYSHSSRENINATLSSGTSSLAPCKAVPPLRITGLHIRSYFICDCFTIGRTTQNTVPKYASFQYVNVDLI